MSILQSSDLAEEVNYTLTGSSTNGSFYMDGNYKATLTLSDLTLTSTDSAAINIEDGKRIAIVLEGTSTLADAASGSQKACFMVNGHSEFAGSGSLTITGNKKHGFWGDEYVQLKKKFTGKITIASAVKDGMSINQYFEMNNGTVTIASAGDDGIQVEATDDADDELNGQVLIKGGTLNVNGVSNVSAGFVKLPQIEAVDVELLEGETKSADAIITEFVSNTSYPNNILVNGGYKISFTGVDATIATLDNVPALARSGNSTTQLKSTYTFTGVAPGEYEVTATVENALGDEVSTTFTVTVVPNVFYVYHSSDGTLEAVPMPDEGETVNLVDKIRTGHRYGGYYNASGAVTEENVNAAKDPALSAGRTGAAVTGAVLYTGDSLKNGSVRFWTKADAAVAGTNDAGTELQPTRGAVYYLKEVPVKYLQSVTRYVYTVETGKLDALYFISDVDDTYYNQLYFDV